MGALQPLRPILKPHTADSLVASPTLHACNPCAPPATPHGRFSRGLSNSARVQPVRPVLQPRAATLHVAHQAPAPSLSPSPTLLATSTQTINTHTVLQGTKPADRVLKGEAEGVKYDYEDKINFSVFPSLQVRRGALVLEGVWGGGACWSWKGGVWVWRRMPVLSVRMPLRLSRLPPPLHPAPPLPRVPRTPSSRRGLWARFSWQPL